MAGFGYGGIGSGIDISTMVSQLVAADRAPQDARLNKQEAVAKFKLSGLGSLTSAFDALKGALDKLQKADSLGARAVKVTGAAPGGSDGASVSAKVAPDTPVGRYEVEVLSLATAHKLVGAGVEPGTTFGAGSLRLSIGDTTVDIDVAEGATLADVRSAIQTAAASHGVRADLVTSDEGQHLSIAGSRTGAENAFSLSLASGSADLQALVDGLAPRSVAADARVSIDGLVTTSGSNSIGTAIPGLTLSLERTGTSTVDVSADPAGSRAAVQEFVNAYNNAIKAIASATAYNSETKSGAALTGDAQARAAGSQLRGAMGDALAALAAQGLDAGTLGLQTRGFPNADGSLVLDAAKFDAAMADGATAIVAALTGPDGLAAKLGTVVGSYVGSEGAFTARSKSLNDQIRDVAKQREALDARMENVARRYQTQFVALDGLIAQLNTTSSYLAQQLSALNAQAQAR